MSRIGRLPVPVPSGVDVTIDGQEVTVKGPKGTLSHTVVEPITVVQETTARCWCTRPDDERDSRARARPHPHAAGQHGHRRHRPGSRRRSRSSASATGSRPEGRDLEFALGFSHPVPVKAPDGITFEVEAPDPVRGRAASTSSRSARSPPTSASCASPTRTRARACATRARSSAARSERRVSNGHPRISADVGAAGVDAPPLPGAQEGHRAAPPVRGWSSPARPATSSPRSSTTPAVTRWRRPRRSTSTLRAAGRATRASAAKAVGALIAERAKAAGIEAGGLRPRRQRKYHGRIAALADGAREAGLRVLCEASVLR